MCADRPKKSQLFVDGRCESTAWNYFHFTLTNMNTICLFVFSFRGRQLIKHLVIYFYLYFFLSDHCVIRYMLVA